MFDFLKTRLCIFVLRTPQCFDFLCLFFSSDLEVKYLQCQHFIFYGNPESYPALLLVLYCRSHRRTMLLFQNYGVLFLGKKKNHLSWLCLWVRIFTLSDPVIVHIPSRALHRLWSGWPLWRELTWGITISESGLGAHRVTYTGKYHSVC